MEKVDILNKHLSFSVKDASFLHFIRKSFEVNTEGYPFEEKFISDCFIIISELGTNLIKYAKGRKEILIRLLKHEDNWGVEIISVDNGPHIDFTMAAVDGFSTGNSLGTGIGTIQRLSDNVMFFSDPQFGNAIVVHKYCNSEQPTLRNPDWVVTPKSGETYCGDAVASIYNEKEGFNRILVSDGLGHGLEASKPSSLAIETLNNYSELGLHDLFVKIHEELAKTRGAALFIMDIYQDKVEYMGIGNISTRLLSIHAKSKGLISKPGIVGHKISRLQAFSEPINKGDVIISYSDGLKSINLDHLLKTPVPIVIASALYSKYALRNDDRSIAVYKH
ncbi:SpoIIE family protein phosphatase [Chondrinema litorale]|uniref:SpoIIE family protein phosphatase n=1 Tax=Chondrinema litorale TaxID=2994555 RepID=UPI0025431593|nr:SpoIIE family protein phosphatase [Chondrinema litorale]UZR98885.1 SpoIIE family protein phosphatase [Chondrinema litorale]